MTEEIIKNPIKYYEDIVDGEDIVIFESGSEAHGSRARRRVRQGRNRAL